MGHVRVAAAQPRTTLRLFSSPFFAPTSGQSLRSELFQIRPPTGQLLPFPTPIRPFVVRRRRVLGSGGQGPGRLGFGLRIRRIQRVVLFARFRQIRHTFRRPGQGVLVLILNQASVETRIIMTKRLHFFGFDCRIKFINFIQKQNGVF